MFASMSFGYDTITIEAGESEEWYLWIECPRIKLVSPNYSLSW